ncbi:MAG: ABC transporter permease [Thiohalocapsa sp.]|uniref:ABC transporter permease n=1 Tax=Thiohalocapsa sp. TaxID=2497641 RepID=UPI0025FA7067|nr:ABC transporter permease [Thiohalocapsa sp.]MCG6941588.1 ABC transporter permease [Thiohalocapsa sp.]
MFQRILALLVARNREFYRDSAGLIWNIAMPVMMIVAFAFIFGGGPEDLFKVGVLGDADAAADASGFLATPHLTFVPMDDEPAAVTKIARHQLDLLLDLRAPGGAITGYWVNPKSPNGDVTERLLLGAFARAGAPPPQRHPAAGEALSYADWALPGVLAMNVMFSSLWGVGWVVVRYRKNGVLRRLKATPLRPLEFLSAQVLSRLMVVMASSTVVYLGALAILDFPMRGSYSALVLTYVAGALCMISLGLLVAARLRTEELADGLLNLMSWPMLLLSGVWFSMEGTSRAAQWLSELMPLTHLVDAARAIMIDGAGVLDVLPQLGLLLALAALLLAVAARVFRWE